MDIENVLDFYLGKNIEDKFTQEFIFSMHKTMTIYRHRNYLQIKVELLCPVLHIEVQKDL
jgi:hypothetical protein